MIYKLSLSLETGVKYNFNMKRSIIYICCAITLLLIEGCKESISESVKVPSGRRDYTWTIDTVKFPPNETASFGRISGSAPNDIWAVCTNTTDLRYDVWHYDGKSWQPYTLPKIVDAEGILSLSQKDVWIGTISGSIWHYDGVNWKESGPFKPEGYDNVIIEGIWGRSSSDLYAYGAAWVFNTGEHKAIILHFNGTTWKLLDLPDIKTDFLHLRKKESTGEIFIMGSEDVEYNLYILKGSNLTEIGKGRFCSLSNIGDEVYFSIDNVIYKYKNGLNKWLDLSGTSYKFRVWGRSESDFFGMTDNYILGHYNGSDFKEMYHLPNYYPVPDALIFDNEVFFLILPYQVRENHILRGKLNQE